MKQKGKTVYDTQGREIATHYLNVPSLTTKYVQKIFYLTNYGNFRNDDEMPDFGIFTFFYGMSAPGEIKVNINLPGFDHKQYKIDGDDNELNHFLIAPLFSWINNPYYHYALPLIPNEIMQ